MAQMVQNATVSGGYSSYSIEERTGFANYINEILAGDPDLADVLPLNPDNESLFISASKGLLLSKLINAVKAGSINEAKLHKGKNPNPFVLTQNHHIAIDACKQLGLKVVNIGTEDLAAAKPNLILALVWQLVRLGLLAKVNLDTHPELVALLEDNEDVSKFMNVAPETTLLRWFNFHLTRAGHPRKVNNFSGDIKDAENYLVLLEQIAPQIVPKGASREPDPRRRAEMVCHYAHQIGCGGFVTPKDILDGNDKLNLAFTAYLFNKLPGLEVIDDNAAQQKALKEAEELLHKKFEEDEALRKAKWLAEEEARRIQWEAEEAARRKLWEEQEILLQQRLAEEAARQRAQLDAEQQALKERLQREEEERRRKQREAEEAARKIEEERRRFELEKEHARLAEEERRRQFETEMRLKEARRREEEEKKRAEEQKRMEEDRRRHFEAQQRALEAEEKRKHEEEMARQVAWAEYFKQQEAVAAALSAAAASADAEERKRQAAWADYYHQQALLAAAAEEERRRLAVLEEEENKRQAAWAAYHAEQAFLAAQQQHMMTTTTVYHPPPPVVTTTVTTTHTNVGKFPVPRLSVTVVRCQNLSKKDKFSKSDPYVVLMHNGKKLKTSSIKNTQNPVWNQNFDFLNVMEHEEIILQVFDKDAFKKDDFMGEIRLKAPQFANGEYVLPLHSRAHKSDKVRGQLVVAVTCNSF